MVSEYRPNTITQFSGRLEAESKGWNRRAVADKQPKAKAHLFDD